MWPLVLTTFITLAAVASQPAQDPDVLYAAREHLPSVEEAAAIWERRVAADPNDFESSWKLARACYWLGGHVATDQRRVQYERGIEAAKRAVAIHADRPEGHFWMAADMGAMAEFFGVIQGMKYRSPIKRELEIVLRLDPAFQQGSADRALGRWYAKVPGLFGGSRETAIEHLQRSLTYDPNSAPSHFFLAEVFLDMNRRDDARRELRAILDAPLPTEWAPEVKEFKEKASALLERLR